jgi:hypothetical protein
VAALLAGLSGTTAQAQELDPATESTVVPISATASSGPAEKKELARPGSSLDYDRVRQPAPLSGVFGASLESSEFDPPVPPAISRDSGDERTSAQTRNAPYTRDSEADANDRRRVFQLLEDRWRRSADPEIEIAYSQSYASTKVDKAVKDAKDAKKEKKWYEKVGIRGYAQVRINAVTDQEPTGAPAQYVGDRSIGDRQNFLIRRARLIFFGDVSDHLYIYLQPDFASNVPGSTDANQFAQIRDWYGDVYLTTDKVHRIRVGSSKVPYGWENMQSSSNRLPLDRGDALNSAVRNERDLGVFYYWTPSFAQDFFKDVMDMGLKGSGNYGMFAFGAYNGQGGSFQEQNDNMHIVTRMTLPFVFENDQRAEFAMQAYTGLYTVLSSPIRPLGVGPAVRPAGTVETGNVTGIRDERIAWTGVWYPQPLGFQAEWNIGRGPALNAAQTAVEERSLTGGYLQTMYKYDTACWGTFFPFLRYNHFRGGYKPERNAPFSRIDEWELGTEWQLSPQVEFTGGYTFTDRTNTTALANPGDVSYRQFNGQIMRFQFQMNY